MRIVVVGLVLCLFGETVQGQALGPARSCESLTSLSLPNTTITLARSVAEGGFTPPKPFFLALPPDLFRPYSEAPAFCRVAGVVKPTMDSEIKFEVWMPLSAWNGKFMGVGNGGWSGEIWYPFMGTSLARGYATASTDTGHEGSPSDASFALGHPEKLTDFAYRAVHETTVKAKAVVAAYYGQAPKLSYWNGCSSGGRQGLKEAQRFPADYDGIIAGAPANYWTHLMAHALWVAQAVHRDEASFIPQSKYKLIHDAVMGACDLRDRVKDGVLENPAQCQFDPKVLQCKAGDDLTCLTSPQVEAARKIYASARTSRTRQEIFPGLAPGAEMGWNGLAGQQPLALATDHFKYVVFKDPNWDYKTLSFDNDVALADTIDSGLINATDPNLRAFFGRGGKILQYHGWNDQLISPLNSVNYYKSVQSAMGGASKVKDNYRLFMAPGMLHCAGGEGPSSFDALSAMEQWLEHNTPPDRIIASRVRNAVANRTRPLCAYPQVAQYKGTGSTDDAANFVCRAP